MIEKEGPIHISNVMLLDPKDNKPTRVGIYRARAGKRMRVDAAARQSESMALDEPWPASRTATTRRSAQR